MRIEAFGDSAWRATELDAPAWRYVAPAMRRPGIGEAWAAPGVLAFVGDPDALEGLEPDPAEAGRLVECPVLYDGPDLDETAAGLGLSPAEYVRRHGSREYEALAVGFRPGFAYLGPLPPEIAGPPRLATPRLRVEAGSVAVAGDRTAIYPQAGPGGWRIVGRSPLVWTDVDFFPLQAGDRVRFRAIGPGEFAARRGERP